MPTTPSALFLLGLYWIALAILSVYGGHRLYLVYLYTRYRRPLAGTDPPDVRRDSAAAGDDRLPSVTVQLAIFNERYVVERLIEAVSRLDYPRNRLEVQILDDSTDATRTIARGAARDAAARGLDIRYVHRAVRTGFKAGALAAGLREARGELIAIFDADFVPEPDFLRRAVLPFRAPDVGMVQARWGHLNRDQSLLTRVQALWLDAHFVLGHGARWRGGLWFNFNGTAGVWRRAAIRAAGGWQHDTLTEDLDLSYRAQLAGWRFVFLEDVVAPAEIPADMNSFKTQQHRWVQGAVQTCFKLLPVLVRSRIPRRVKIDACLRLTAPFHYPVLLLVVLVTGPVWAFRAHGPGASLLWVDAAVFAAAAWSLVHVHVVGLRVVGRDWVSELRYLPLLMAVGIGLSVTAAWAVIRARAERVPTFHRTPKDGGMVPSAGRYRAAAVVHPGVEAGLGLYCTAAVVYALAAGIWLPLPLLCVFQVGFLYTAGLSLAPAAGSMRP